ncbi:MAG: hypothetical protein IPJ81_19380 [Chitinophagaceae bacterium]|nr:hypothetical protein [Chitinophagaceae bacterium]
MQSAALTVKTYFGKNRLINSYTKKFSNQNKQQGKFLLKYKLIQEYKNYKKYCGKEFDQSLLGDTAYVEEPRFLEADQNFEYIYLIMTVQLP